jgi:uncharacterized membrane protein
VYEWLLAAHIVGAVTWIGGSLTLLLLGSRARRSQNATLLASFARDAAWIEQRVYLPASVVVLVAGLALVAVGQWPYESLWIGIGLVAIIASALTGALFVGPQLRHLGNLIAERGPEEAQVSSRMNRILTVSRIELVVLFLVVIDMAVKPGA